MKFTKCSFYKKFYLFSADSCKPASNFGTDEEYSPPKFTKLLTDVLVREGDTAVLECAVSGYPQPEIKWFLNTSEVIFSDRVQVFFFRIFILRKSYGILGKFQNIFQ